MPDVLTIDLAHTGPGTLAGRYMRMFWQPVYVSEELPSGRSVPIRIMSEECTLREPASWTKRTTLYAAYRIWCEESGRGALGKYRFYDRARRLGGVTEKKRNGIVGFGGIEFRHPSK